MKRVYKGTTVPGPEVTIRHPNSPPAEDEVRPLGSVWRDDSYKKPWRVQAPATRIGFRTKKHAQAVADFLKRQALPVDPNAGSDFF